MSNYQAQAETTAIYKDKIEQIVDDLFDNNSIDVAKEKIVNLLSFAYVVLGLVGEAGEIANKAKKVIRDGAGKITPEFREDIKDEISDVYWYQANLASELNLKVDDILQHNLDKLFDRKARGVLGGSGDKR